MLDTHTEVHGAAGRAGRLPPLRRGIEFRDVSFAYDDGSGDYVLRDVSFTVPRRPDGRDRRAERRGQDDARQPDAAVLRRDRRRHPDRRRRHPRRDARVAARADRHRHAGDGALRRHHREQHRVRRRRTRRAAEIEAAARAAHAHEFIVDAAGRLRRRRSASAASGCRAASGSGWRSRARS